jgi:hypothetical protein
MSDTTMSMGVELKNKFKKTRESRAIKEKNR